MGVKKILIIILSIVASVTSFANDYFIATASVNVRTGAGKGYAVTFKLQEGDEVEVLSKNGSWYQVRYLGKTGFVHSKYLKSTSETPLTIQQSESGNSGLAILIVLGGLAFLWILPILIIISSDKTTSGEKMAWILAVIFISWFAWIFYMLLAPIKKKEWII